jgi:hypothetical protein
MVQKRVLLPFSIFNKYSHQSLGFIEEKNPDSDTILIYYHGNAETAYDAHYRLLNIKCNKYHIEYPGYSDIAKESMGNEDSFWRAMTDIYQTIVGKNPGKTVIIYGRSIGTGVVCGLLQRLCLVDYPNKIILETPIQSMDVLLSHHIGFLGTFLSSFAQWKKMNHTVIEEFDGPVLVLASDNDYVTPFGGLKKVYEGMEKCDLFVHPKANHIMPDDFVIPKVAGWLDGPVLD